MIPFKDERKHKRYFSFLTMRGGENDLLTKVQEYNTGAKSGVQEGSIYLFGLKREDCGD